MQLLAEPRECQMHHWCGQINRNYRHSVVCKLDAVSKLLTFSISIQLKLLQIHFQKKNERLSRREQIRCWCLMGEFLLEKKLFGDMFMDHLHLCEVFVCIMIHEYNLHHLTRYWMAFYVFFFVLFLLYFYGCMIFCWNLIFFWCRTQCDSVNRSIFIKQPGCNKAFMGNSDLS